jgi:uncharacterized small protein (DUF1192 family)
MTLTRREVRAIGRDSLERLAVELQAEVERLRAENKRLNKLAGLQAAYLIHKGLLREFGEWVEQGMPDSDLSNPSSSNPSLEARSTAYEP